ncbi:12158_t:CDS:2, partial [Acaulospora colombiana]
TLDIQKYIDHSYFGNILPHNKEAKQMLKLANMRLRWPSVTNVNEVDELIQTIDKSTTSNNTASEEPQEYVRLTAALSAISDYRSAMIDLSNPFTTLQWNVLVTDFLGKAQDLLRLPFNPMVSGISPFAVTVGQIIPLDFNVTFLENLYRQAAGQNKSFEKCAHIASFLWKFGFKEYVTHKIPMKRVINGAYICYVDPLNKTYYYTTLVLDPFRFKVLKNLLIYEIVSGKAAYIHSALYFYMSMCTCEEDFNLMNEYGVIEWDFPMEGYAEFCEKMKELLDI